MCNCDYCNESEEENSFWGDVYYYIQEHSCSQDEAIKAMKEFYFAVKTDKHVYCTNCNNFRRDNEDIPYCPFEDTCDINDCEDSRSIEDRPMYERKEN